jgi:hypothetical protein
MTTYDLNSNRARVAELVGRPWTMLIGGESKPAIAQKTVNIIIS